VFSDTSFVGVQMPNSCPPRVLWGKICSGFYFMGL